MSDDLVKRLREGDAFERTMSAQRAADRIEELEAKLAGVTSERDQAVQGDFPLDDKSVTWHELCERWKGCCFDTADRLEELEAKLANAVVALDKIKRIDNLVGVFAACERTLAELKGGTDEDSNRRP